MTENTTGDLSEAEQARKILDYDSETGVFTWRARPVKVPRDNNWNANWAGKRAGSVFMVRGVPYMAIRVNYRSYLAHRLAWLYVHGEWPSALIDHEDRNPLNNRIGNLRLATGTQNLANAKVPRHNASGIKGVSLFKRSGKWRASVQYQGKANHIGYFDNIEDAARAYASAAASLFGEFATDGQREVSHV